MPAHLTPEERAAHGRTAREACPRRSHASFEPTGRDAIALLEEQAATRIPELVPIRYGRMLVSPFAFHRGTTAVMAYDFAPLPRSGLEAQLCGDAHLGNFGGFGSPERNLVFDLNDFDETLGKSDTFDEALATFAAAYANQNERDYEAFRQAAADGRIEVVENL